jgi:ribosomal protein S18 acetylase RimI-like enzyme
VAIAPTSRGQRLAGELVHAALTHGCGVEVRSVDLVVFAANLPAVRTYQAVGFTDIGAISPDYPTVRRMSLELAGLRAGSTDGHLC